MKTFAIAAAALAACTVSAQTGTPSSGTDASPPPSSATDSRPADTGTRMPATLSPPSAVQPVSDTRAARRSRQVMGYGFIRPDGGRANAHELYPVGPLNGGPQ